MPLYEHVFLARQDISAQQAEGLLQTFRSLIEENGGTVGKTGFLRLGFERRGSRTILADLDRRSPYMAQRALHCDQTMPDLAHVFLITTTGCLLQGDRLALDITLGPGARAHVTSQSATKIHAMDANYAAQTQTITLADDAYLEFLPDPVIPHRRARFVSDTDISVAPSATRISLGVMLKVGFCGSEIHCTVPSSR